MYSSYYRKIKYQKNFDYNYSGIHNDFNLYNFKLMETLIIIREVLTCIFLLILIILASGFTIRFYNGWIQETINKRLKEKQNNESIT